jgi:hypothetical protein
MQLILVVLLKILEFCFGNTRVSSHCKDNSIMTMKTDK